MSRAKRKPLEYIKFFWRDFNRDTPHLTRAQRDGYLQILCAYYDNQGALHESQVKRASGATDDEWTDERNLMSEFFVVSASGMWKHKRIEEELKVVRATKKKRSIAGKKSGEERAKRTRVQQVLNKSSTTKDVKGNSPSAVPLLPNLVLSQKEQELLDAQDRVAHLQRELSQAMPQRLEVVK